jgi:hypothetical protein
MKYTCPESKTVQPAVLPTSFVCDESANGGSFCIRATAKLKKATAAQKVEMFCACLGFAKMKRIGCAGARAAQP